MKKEHKELKEYNNELIDTFNTIKITVDKYSDIEKVDSAEVDSMLSKIYFKFCFKYALVTWLISIIIHGLFRISSLDTLMVSFMTLLTTFLYEPYYKHYLSKRYTPGQFEKYFSNKMNDMKITIFVVYILVIFIYFAGKIAIDKSFTNPWIG
ncbi:hypothetical protein K4S27_11075 [Staphylococcus epidermidis]|nr:hypothetical protein [Staphylococcus epidermidis]MCG2360219.1 hypothetical protein [Staphylococcus epidermidis]MCG2367173.1 hypothetical protein [Staphylococcus epidermidis]